MMDLESECSVYESVEDNELITPENLANVDGNKIENNGFFGGEYGDDNSLANGEDNDARVRESVSLSPLAGSVGSPPPAATKGYGLKRRRRIRGEFNQDGSSTVDTSKILKRVWVLPLMVLPYMAQIWTLDMKKTVVGGPTNDKNKMRTLGGKNLINSVHRGLQGKSRAETSKKHRGERRTETVTSNGRQSKKVMDYDGENSDEVQDGEQHSDEDVGTSHSKENVGEFEALSQEDLAADLYDNHRSSTDRDPLVESIQTLLSAQEELEKEVQKLREIGTQHVSLCDGSTNGSSLPSGFASLDSRIDEATSSELTQSSSHLLETRVASLKHSTNPLESKLEEANNMIKVKEAKVIELEYALKSNESLKEEMSSTIESQHEKYRDVEAELEGLFKQKIEAEVEYLAIASTNQKLRVASEDQVALFEEQKTLASEQAQILNELGDVESKAEMLKRQAEKLETYYEDVVGTEQVLKLEKMGM
ncbi:WPP domain interacting protein 2 [Actinidia rufa]|uniref:WPP domain interacting protein 2 n=1 Tax=Actinidia rufa TaxID=165716 RepID=A0A7J0GQE9_9ERIC|nr:WPP domain interacting protein 2 [Actinidia rufa]